MKKVKQEIIGNKNIQVTGDYITTQRVVKRVEIKPDYDVHISEFQCKQIHDKVDEIVKMITSDDSEKKKSAYPQVWGSIKKRFNVASYRCISKGQFDEVMAWLQKEIASKYRKMLRKSDNDEWRKQYYKSIHARANQLGLNIHDYAMDVLELKKPISSLTKLSDTRLKKLYMKLYNKR
jgi:hypothetical protein